MDVKEYEKKFHQYLKITDKEEKAKFLAEVRKEVEKLNTEERLKIKEKANELADWAIQLGHEVTQEVRK